jgi:hypothetical protein
VTTADIGVATLIRTGCDPGAMDLFSKFVQIQENYEWRLRDTLRNGDGLSA